MVGSGAVYVDTGWRTPATLLISLLVSLLVCKLGVPFFPREVPQGEPLSPLALSASLAPWNVLAQALSPDIGT